MSSYSSTPAAASSAHSVSGVLRALRQGIFGVLRMLQKKEQPLRPWMVYVLALVQFFQSLHFISSFPAGFVWPGKTMMSAESIISFSSPSSYFASLQAMSSGALPAFFFSAILWVAFFLGLFCWCILGSMFNYWPMVPPETLVPVLAAAGRLSAGVLFIPLLTTMLRGLSCGSNPNMPNIFSNCNDFQYAISVPLVAILAPLFVMLAGLFTLVFYDSNPLSLSSEARAHGRADFALLISRVLLVIFVDTYPNLLSAWSNLAVVALCSLMWFIPSVVLLPFYDATMNRINIAFSTSFAWSVCCLALSLARPDIDVGVQLLCVLGPPRMACASSCPCGCAPVPSPAPNARNTHARTRSPTLLLTRTRVFSCPCSSESLSPLRSHCSLCARESHLSCPLPPSSKHVPPPPVSIPLSMLTGLYLHDMQVLRIQRASLDRLSSPYEVEIKARLIVHNALYGHGTDRLYSIVDRGAGAAGEALGAGRPRESLGDLELGGGALGASTVATRRSAAPAATPGAAATAAAAAATAPALASAAAGGSLGAEEDEAMDYIVAVRGVFPEAAQAQVLALYKSALLKFRSSAILHVFFARFYAILMGNRHLQLSHLLQAERMHPPLDISFLVYMARKTAEESGGSQLNALGRITFEKYLKDARKSVLRAGKRQFAFFSELVNPLPDLSRLHRLSSEMNQAVAESEYSFAKLTATDPT